MIFFSKRFEKKTPDCLRSQEQQLKQLTKEELYEFYLNQGYSDDDAMALSGMAELEEDTESE